MSKMKTEDIGRLRAGIEANDVASVAALLKREPELRVPLAENRHSIATQAIERVRSTAMVDLLLEHGLSAERITEWWAPGFGLNRVSPEVATHLIRRGVMLTPHAAAALGMSDLLSQMLDRNPALVHAKGGDGCRPLHFSRTVETARLLLDRGADLEARDDDHGSTAAQWRIGDAPEVTRFLLDRGAQPDIFMAAGLGDLALAQTMVELDPACTSYRIGNNRGPFPGIGFKARGGTIYQWTLEFNASPQEVAIHRGHRDVFDLLMRHTTHRSRLLVACMLADRAMAEAIAEEHPQVIAELDDQDRSLLAKSCWETNRNIEAVRLMLDLGFPVDVPESNHGYLPLHNAAWCGDAALVELLLRHGHPVDRRDPGYQATALGYAIHSCTQARRHPEGDFPAVVKFLLEAGVPLDENQFPTGHPGMDAVIDRCRGK
ncbi:MAG: hypothetical protein JNN07_14870 [Verrucomicrobiales bacterium]|nr:hypothetical protein [Verrucomicrobiales bacterium]